MYQRDLYELELRLFYYTPFTGITHRSSVLEGIHLEIHTCIYADPYEDMAAASRADHHFDVVLCYERGKQKPKTVTLASSTTMRTLGVGTLNPYAIITSPVIQAAMALHLPATVTGKLSVYNRCYRDYTFEEFFGFIQQERKLDGVMYHARFTIGDFTATIEYGSMLGGEAAQISTWAVLYNDKLQRIANSYMEHPLANVMDADDLENRCWAALMAYMHNNDDYQTASAFEALIRMRNIERMLELV